MPAGADDIAGGLGHGALGPEAGIEIAKPAGAIGGHGQGFFGLTDAQHGGVRARPHGGVSANHGIVLIEHPALVTDIRRRQHCHQGLVPVAVERVVVHIQGGNFVHILRAAYGASVHGRPAAEDEILGRNLRNDLAVETDRHQAVGGYLTDYGRIQPPLVKDLADRILFALFDTDQHAFLRLGEENFIRRHAGFADRHLVDIEHHPRLTLGGHFRRTTGYAGRAHVLHADDEIFLDYFQGCFQE